MKHCVFILPILFIASCSNRKNPSEYYPKGESVYQTQEEDKKLDTLRKDTPKETVSSVIGSVVSHHKEKELDNMRGFDPASEDDMDDNGMSRYMENNDEEGWD